MKPFRILTIISLAVMSLMNVGYALGTDPNVAVAIAALVLGLAGLVVVSALAWDAAWGVPAALAVAGINVVAACIALVNDSDGAVIALVVSAIALVSAFAAGAGRRTTSAA
jgi:hypothetical protein